MLRDLWLDGLQRDEIEVIGLSGPQATADFRTDLCTHQPSVCKGSTSQSLSAALDTSIDERNLKPESQSWQQPRSLLLL